MSIEIAAKFLVHPAKRHALEKLRPMRPTIRYLMIWVLFSMAPRGGAAAPVVEWIRTFGTSEIDYHQLGESSADGTGNYYVAGSTYGSLAGPNAGPGLLDGYIRKYNDTGSLVWGRQLGTSKSDELHGASVDSEGNVYVTGATPGDLGTPNAGLSDVFLRKYNSAGDVLWTRLHGTALIDNGYGIAAGTVGNVYVAGNTQGNLGSPNQGLTDAFLSRFGSASSISPATTVTLSISIRTRSPCTDCPATRPLAAASV